MRHLIDPLVDYAFKRLFGTPSSLHLLKHFLNAVLQPASPIVTLVLLNPLNERDFADDKLTIIDVKATDANGRVFQVEAQLLVTPELPARMLQNWATLYTSQLKRGDDFDALCPVLSIWVVDGAFLPGSLPHSRFELLDPQQGIALIDHLSIHVLELQKWKRSLAPEDDWIEFLKDARGWTELPAPLSGKRELIDAMAILNEIAEVSEDYELYQRRLDAYRIDLTNKNRFAKVTRRLEEAEDKIAEEQRLRAEEQRLRAEEQQLRAEEQQLRVEEQRKRALAEAEVEHLRALLAERNAGTP